MVPPVPGTHHQPPPPRGAGGVGDPPKQIKKPHQFQLIAAFACRGPPPRGRDRLILTEGGGSGFKMWPTSPGLDRTPFSFLLRGGSARRRIRRLRARAVEGPESEGGRCAEEVIRRGAGGGFRLY